MAVSSVKPYTPTPGADHSQAPPPPWPICTYVLIFELVKFSYVITVLFSGRYRTRSSTPYGAVLKPWRVMLERCAARGRRTARSGLRGALLVRGTRTSVKLQVTSLLIR